MNQRQDNAGRKRATSRAFATSRYAPAMWVADRNSSSRILMSSRRGAHMFTPPSSEGEGTERGSGRGRDA
jgi:hypothetical protein